MSEIIIQDWRDKISFSMLDTFSRCMRRGMYRYKLGLVPKEVPEHMVIGSATHAAIAEGYRNYANRDEFLRHAERGLYAFVSTEEGRTLTPEQIALVRDMVQFWWEHSGSTDEYDEIVTVEEHLIFQYTEGGFDIRCTPDVIARKNGKLILTDHKTVGSISETLAFLPLDMQLKLYACAVAQKYNEIPRVDYNLIRRELPPNFERADGSHPYSLTPTGRKSTRSTNPSEYTYRLAQTYTLEALDTFVRDDLDTHLADIATAFKHNTFKRTVLKNGVTACTEKGCPYWATCTYEADGNKISGVDMMMYNRDTVPCE